MPVIDQNLVEGYITAGANAANTTGKGRALEDLICYVFERVPGIVVTQRNEMNVFMTEEVDVAFWNDGVPDGLPFLPYVILVEAKNWSNNVGSTEVSWFDTKIRNRGQDFGILVAKKGITGSAKDLTRAHFTVATALAEKRKLIVITVNEIRALANTDDLVMLIKTKICELCLKGAIA